MYIQYIFFYQAPVRQSGRIVAPVWKLWQPMISYYWGWLLNVCTGLKPRRYVVLTKARQKKMRHRVKEIYLLDYTMPLRQFLSLEWSIINFIPQNLYVTKFIHNKMYMWQNLNVRFFYEANFIRNILYKPQSLK